MAVGSSIEQGRAGSLRQEIHSTTGSGGEVVTWFKETGDNWWLHTDTWLGVSTDWPLL